MAIVWNDKARSQTTPRRREDVPAFKAGNANTHWSTLRKALNHRRSDKFDPIEHAFKKGSALTSPELGALMDKCYELAQSEIAPHLDDRDLAVVLMLIMSKYGAAAAEGLVLASGSVPFAFDVHLRSLELVVVPAWVSWNDPFRVTAAPPDRVYASSRFRAILLAQPDDIRAQCKEIARGYLERSPSMAQRAAIANAFFEEHDWAASLCRDWLASGGDKWPTDVAYAIAPDLALAEQLLDKRAYFRSLLDLVQTFGEAAMPMLIKAADNPRDAHDARYIAEALGLFDDPIAALAMVKLLENAKSRPFVLAYFGTFPHHAEATLAAIDEKGLKGRAAKIAREVLAGAQRAATAMTSPAEEATPEELPSVLANPPWEAMRRPKKPSTRLELALAAAPERVDWLPDERERSAALFPRNEKDIDATPETLAEYDTMLADGKIVGFLIFKSQRLPDDRILATWNAGRKTHGFQLQQKVSYALAKFGDAAFPGLAAFVDETTRGWGDFSFLLRVVSWRLAVPFVKNLGERRIGKIAWQWLTKHAELAVLALVPVAFGDDDDARPHAERGLFRLRAAGVDVLGIGARYGAPAKAALEKLFTWDPVFDLPKTIPKLGPAWHPETLTRPRLVNGKALPLSALQTIGTMLAFTPLQPPYAGLTQIKEACEPHSLAELAWDAARGWEHSGHKQRERWMLMSLVHLADDEVVRRMTPGIRPDFAVDVLETIASDAALMELATIASRTQSQGGQWTLAGRIEKLLDNAAEARGVTKDELEEDLAPTTVLDDDGMLTLDYGSRKLKVGFDQRLEAYVINDAGVRVRAIPPARKDDDEASIARAKVIWADLKEDVSVIAQRRIKALERAMMSMRTWPVDRFRRVWIEHRLMKHLARGVLWITNDKESPTTFRVAEDGSLSNVDDAAVKLAPDARIGIAHPLLLDPKVLDRWRTIFQDYELVQPFAQLSRDYATFDPAATRIAWPWASITVADLTQRLIRQGFRHGPYNAGRYAQIRDVRRGIVQVEFKNAKGKADDISIVFMRAGKEISASELDAIEIADVIYELQS